MEKEEKTMLHNIEIKERKSIYITGIKKIESFDKNEFFINTVMGYMLIKGDNLELLKLDTISSDIAIKGKIDSINYLEDKNKNNKESILTRLFK